jgi:STE24 endopeptidase
MTYWLSPLSNFLSRKHEFEADDYAVWATGSSDHLSSALKKLSVKNLSYPLPHPLVSFFYHSHPSLPERELNINKAHERFADGQTS